MEKEYDLFVSYQSADKEFATKLATDVENVAFNGRRLKVFFDEWDIEPRQDIVARIDHGLAKSRFVGLVLSPEYMQAEWPTAEKNAALFKDPAGRLGHVIPIRFRKCNLPPLLAFRKYVDFSKDHKRGLERLLAILTGQPLPRGHAPLEGHGQTSDSEIAMRLLNASAPDDLPEAIYPNLFPVSKLPSTIWSSPTAFHGLGDMIRKYGYGRLVPPHTIWSGRLYTFANLTRHDHPFLGVTEDYDVQHEEVSDWLNDPEKARRLVWLLNDCVRAITTEHGMSYDREGKKYYYREGVLKESKFQAYGKGKPKDLIFDYSKKTPPRPLVAHRAVRLNFELLGKFPFLKVEAGWVFFTPEGTLIEGNRRIALNARFTSGQKNPTNFSEVRFWTWLLSEGQHLMRCKVGDAAIEIDTSPAPVEIGAGIYGDARKLTPVAAPPELLFEDETATPETDETEQVEDDESTTL